MRKCEVPTSPECFAEAAICCSDCSRWFCADHWIEHKQTHKVVLVTDLTQLQKRVEELEHQNKVLLKRAEDAETLVRVLSKDL